MAAHIQAAGFELHVFNRTRAKAGSLIERGAVWHDTPSSLANACEVIVTIVGYPEDVESLYLGERGILASGRPGCIVIDMTTSSPSLAMTISAAADLRRLNALDAPVSGGDIGARNAKLSIMVGGERRTYERALPILQAMGRNIVHMGSAGFGQHAKIANQIAIASTMMAVSESIAYAKRAGLNPAEFLEAIGQGAASSFLLNALGPKMIGGDFAPGFFVRHFIKDLEIALLEAAKMELPLPGLDLAHMLYRTLAEKGHAGEGTQALYRLYSAAADDNI